MLFLQKLYIIMETPINIPRPHYLDRILPYVDKGVIKVLTGQRRVGKSYILKSVENLIRRSNHEANIIYISLEDFAFSHITDAIALNAEIQGKSMRFNLSKDLSEIPHIQ